MWTVFLSKDAISIHVVVQKVWMLPNVNVFVCLFVSIDVGGPKMFLLDVQLPKYGFLGWRSTDAECQRHRWYRRVSYDYGDCHGVIRELKIWQIWVQVVTLKFQADYIMNMLLIFSFFWLAFLFLRKSQLEIKGCFVLVLLFNIFFITSFSFCTCNPVKSVVLNHLKADRCNIYW